MEKKIPFTQEAYDQLVKDLNNLKNVERPRVLQELIDARAQGDLSENAEYHAAKEKQAETLIRIQELEMTLRSAEITDHLMVDQSEARIGATVTIKDVAADLEFTYTLVGPMESNPDKGLLSVKSPLASGVLGHKEGDEFVAQLPKGPRTYKLVKLEYK